MKNNSIKKTLPRIIRNMVLVLILLILPANIWLQISIIHGNQEESSREVFGQFQQLIETNNRDLELKKQEFSERCIQAADAAAYFVSHDSSVTSNFEQTRELAEKLDIDELHFFTPDGKIYFGTHPQYYGYTFHSGEQMEFFLPMLEDKNLKLCQEIMPNTAEKKEMQYAAVWLEDGSGIVQIGMEPRRLMEIMEEKSLKKVVSSFPFDLRGYFHVVDKNAMQIIASTAESMIGKDMSQKLKSAGALKNFQAYHYKYDGKRYCVYSQVYKDYILLRSYTSIYPIKEVLVSSMLVLLYVGVAAIVVIVIITWYVNKQLSNNLTQLVDDLKKIENGHLESIHLKTRITELDDLIFYINQMMQSIRLNWNKLSHVIDKGQLPVGIFEDNVFYKKTFLNQRLLEILGIGDYEGIPSAQLNQMVKERLYQAEQGLVDSAEQIYRYNKNGSEVYLRIEKILDEQSMTYYVTDVSLWWGEIYQLREKSNRDPLTELYNRRGFNDKVSELFKTPEILGYAMILMLDADGLKKINDVYGHRTGDAYLKEISDQLRESVGKEAVCARLGGDEFVAFVYGYSSYRELEEIIANLKEKRGSVFMQEHSERKEAVEFSLGCAFYPMDGTDYHLLMHLADETMYQEKRSRKSLCGRP